MDRDIDRDDQSFCRSEGRWRLEGVKRKPKLVFWRETKDCEGKQGWVVVSASAETKKGVRSGKRTPCLFGSTATGED